MEEILLAILKELQDINSRLKSDGSDFNNPDSDFHLTIDELKARNKQRGIEQRKRTMAKKRVAKRKREADQKWWNPPNNRNHQHRNGGDLERRTSLPVTHG